MKTSISKTSLFALTCILLGTSLVFGQEQRPREYGIKIGVLKTGVNNAITEVPGVKVGHKTMVEDGGIRTGVTAILPHDGNIFQQKVPGAIYLGK